MEPELTHPIPDPAAPPRTRRALLAATLGALGRPVETHAAAGSPLILGQTNYAGSSATRLNATSSGGAFWMTQNGSGSGVRGESWNGTGGVFLTHHPDRQGLLAQQLGAFGSGAALRAEGGANTGVSGTSTDYFGVLGTSSNSIGVRGFSTGDYGVYGSSSSSVGVRGYSSSGYGVSGYSGSSHAGHFVGTCYATSFTTVSSPTVRLDHPLVPATKVLAHAAVVSDEAATLYSGTVTTDADGQATVSLPDWLEALNTELRYQLTPIGAAAPGLYVKAKLRDGAFSIAGASPGQEISWQLTGVRRDAYAAAHPLVVESRKTGNEKGRYLTTLELGQPEIKGVDWEARQRATAITATAST